jgi:NADPH:quinone reductase-like Zn-dependent oxidoreductase
MRSYRLDAGTGLDGLRLDVSGLPVPGPGEVLVEVRAASLSYREAMILEGRYVLPVRAGGIPDDLADLTDAEAATLPVAGLTAWNALTHGLAGARPALRAGAVTLVRSHARSPADAGYAAGTPC